MHNTIAKLFTTGGAVKTTGRLFWRPLSLSYVTLSALMLAAQSSTTHAAEKCGDGPSSILVDGLLTVTGDLVVEGSENNACYDRVIDLQSVIVENGASITSDQKAAIAYRPNVNGGIQNDGIGGFILNRGDIIGDGRDGILFEGDSGNRTGLTGSIENYGLIEARRNSKAAIEMVDDAIIDGSIYNYDDGIIRSTDGAAQGIHVRIRSEIKGGIINDGSIQAGGDRAAIEVEIDSEVSRIFNGEGGVIENTKLNGGRAIYIHDASLVGSITNFGTIRQNKDGVTDRKDIEISKGASLIELNNFQGGGPQGRLHLYVDGNNTEKGPTYLPSRYNVIISGDEYGQLELNRYSNNVAGQMMFGVFDGSNVKVQTYEDVMVGFGAQQIANTWAQDTVGDHRAFGTSSGFVWMLDEKRGPYDQDVLRSASDWDLIVLAPVTSLFSGGVEAVAQRATDLQGKVDTGGGSAYECEIGVNQSGCVSVKGGYVSQGDGASNGAAMVLGALRLNSKLKAGAFLEQGFSYESPDDIEYSSTMPSLGGFLAFSQNDDDTGIQAKSSAAISQGEAKISRENLLGSAAMASGTADISGYALAQTFGYGIGIDNMSVMTPYVGIGYVSSTRDGYEEDSDVAGIDDAFDFSSYGQQATIGAVGLAYELDNHDGFTLRAGAGLSYVLNSDADDLEATSTVPGIETLSANSAYDQTGDVGMTGDLGSNYAITENQRIGFDASAWRSVSTGDYGYGVMAGWTMSFGGGEQSLGK